MRFFLFLILLISLNTELYSQSDISNKILHFDKREYPLVEFFDQASKQLGLEFSYTSDLNHKELLKLPALKGSMKFFLEHLIDTQAFNIRYSNKKIFIIAIPIANRKFTISGFVYDIQTGESLINASVHETRKYNGTLSNNYGFYSLKLNSGLLQLRGSYVGYKEDYRDFILNKDTIINFYLKTNTKLNEVMVKAKKNDPLKGNYVSSGGASPLSALFFNSKNIDLFTSVMKMPGVQAGNEAFGGFVVRNGSHDQNLILLDDVPIYYSNHFYSYFSIFNSIAIKHVNLIKGGFPARYGGRVSSVLDVRMQDGDTKRLRGEVYLSLMTAKININGPLKKNKTSFNLSLRRSYVDLFLNSTINSFDSDFDYSLYFGDLNFKLVHRFSPRNKIYLNTYWGGDVIKSSEPSSNEGKLKFMTGWGNFVNSLRWNYVCKKNVFLNTSLIFSKYTYLMIEKKTYSDYQTEYDFKSGIRDYTIKTDIDWIPNNKTYIRSGLSFSVRNYKPSDLEYFNTENTDLDFDRIQNIFSKELVLWSEYQLQLRRNMQINLGARLTNFRADDGNYFFLEPRLKFIYDINHKIKFTASYSEMTQFIHLLRMGSIKSPTDIWMPVSGKVKPIQAYHHSLSLDYKLNSNLNFSLAYYHKLSKNIIEMRNTSIFNDNWRDNLSVGKSLSKGVEFNISKTRGLTRGNIAYTISNSKFKFSDINNNNYFASPYDRPYLLSIYLKQKINSKFNFSLAWVYGAGQPFSLAYKKANLISPHDHTLEKAHVVGDKLNTFRLPNYHRLDVVLNFIKKKKRGERTWTISVKNIYDKRNVSYISFGSYTNMIKDNSYSMRKLCFYPFMPNISYSYKF